MSPTPYPTILIVPEQLTMQSVKPMQAVASLYLANLVEFMTAGLPAAEANAYTSPRNGTVNALKSAR
jgi:hypothetical protein